jgi:hypothetical protein
MALAAPALPAGKCGLVAQIYFMPALAVRFVLATPLSGAIDGIIFCITQEKMIGI